MKHLYLISFASFILLAACKKEKISGSGSVVTETRALNNFTSVQASGPVMIFIEKGPQISVKVKAFENLLPYFESNVTNGVLDVHWKNNIDVHGDLTVYVTLPELRSVKVSGRSATRVQGEFSGTDMEVSLSGGAYVFLYHQQADNFLVTLSGTGFFPGLGTVTHLDAFGMTCKKATVNLTGDGTVELSCLNELKVKIAGPGDVLYKGNPIVVSDISGGGMLYKR